MRRSLWITAAAAVLAYAAMQSSNPQPGRNRPDAPSQFELGRKAIPTGTTSRYNTPTQADPEPPPDSRITAPLRMTDDTRSYDFPDILSNPKNRAEVWSPWLSYSGRPDELRLPRYDAASHSRAP